MKFVYQRYLNYIFHLGVHSIFFHTPGWVSCTRDSPWLEAILDLPQQQQ